MAKTRTSGMYGFKPGVSGNPHGRAPASREQFKFDYLDETAIPAAIRHLYSVVMGTHPDVIASKGIDKVRAQNEAARALLSKAPERMAGHDGKALPTPILGIAGIQQQKT